ncbi:autotransporter outer membrane beta-barrel domain-containing protein [Pusillimonas sp. NJUB218]|uniref:autotransporter outer membrane beta-barrel domain-containing protein n=1 Tax=Pusillimonas sp. NJUB218 TaxID=2023230 RepID=UPI00131572EF|nr:autotransporter outer membrane beta-barrel domain-containing protein [Pusillimonas sp. NJUB218]
MPATPFRTISAGALVLGMFSVTFGAEAQAAPGPINTGGTWYGAGEDCSASATVASYGGRCAVVGENSASNAEVVIYEETPDEWIYGGFVKLGVNQQASDNTITVQPGAAAAAVIGGRALGGESGAVANNNTVLVYGGQLGSVYGGQSTTETAGNKVEITGGTLTEVAGGNGGGGKHTNNSVMIKGSGISVSGIVWGASVNGTGSVSGNSVSITDASVGNTVFGGFVSRGNATSNTVRLSGSASVAANVYGGYSGTSGDALNNRVIIEGSPNLSNTLIYGGYSGAGVSAGNILEVRSLGLKMGNIRDFQELHFILPANTQANAEVITLSGKAPGKAGQPPIATDLRGVKVGVGIVGGANVLQNGDRVTLIHNPIGVETDATIAQADVSGYQGISLKYTFGLSADAKNLYATAKTDAVVMEQTKAPVEGQASMMALSVQGGDLAAGAGIARAMGATSGASGTSTFGASSGGSSRYKSGSHVDVDGYSLMLGAAKKIPQGTGQLMAGVFVEGGWGKYKTYNEFSTGVVRGSGKSRYAGGGVLLRRDWAVADAQGRSETFVGTGLGLSQAAPYVEGSLRVGRVSSNWDSNDMQGSTDASYDTSALYYGLHAGVGYMLPIGTHSALDFSAKYFWTHQQGDKVTIAGDPYHFQSVDSHRTRLGVRWNHQLSRQVAGYLGAAWEREFDGAARATVYGLDTPSPSLKGNTGVFELGFELKPRADDALTIGLGAQAFTGMRQGFSGVAKVMFVF